MLALVLKLTLAPGLVATATRVARLLGHRAAGLVGGLPAVAGPIVLIYTVEQGQGFAREAAAGAVLGIASLVAFCVAYGMTARTHETTLALAAGWLAFAAGTAAFSPVRLPLAVSTVVTLACIGRGTVVLRRAAPVGGAPRAGRDLLPWRLGITATLVVALTAVAGHVPAHLAGLLAPFPIITAVLAGFTQAANGGGAAIELLAGLTSALVSFTAFFAVLAASIAPLGAAGAFIAATAAAVAVWGALVALSGERT